jgi:hypothetical protein
MALQDPAQIRDRSSDFFQFWLKKRQAELRPLVTETLLNEHRANPVGADRSHSRELTLVLNFLRSMAGDRKEFIYRAEGADSFGVGLMRGRGAEVDDSLPARYSTLEDAYHAVFLMRLRGMGLL